MKPRFFLLWLMAGFLSTNLFAQSKLYKDALFSADEFFDQGPNMHRKALVYYLRADSMDPSRADIKYRIGRCYLNSSLKYNAQAYFQKASELNPNVSFDIHYYLGYCFQLDLKWDQAQAEYELFKAKLSPNKKENRKDLVEVSKRLEEVAIGKDLVQHPVRAQIENLGSGINGPYTDYSPVISADESVLMFTSRRNNTTGGKVDPNYDEFYEDIFVSNRFNNTWTIPENLGPPVNTPGHDATINLSPDGQKLLIYIDDDGSGNIYMCKLEGDKWSKPEPFPRQISSKAHESAASYSFDEKTLYFVSDRSGGLGGSDIYACSLDENGKWGEARNLGPSINTSYDEQTPFMMPDGKTMYFSSKGHASMGGFDIFKAEMDTSGNFGPPTNIGYPVNTPDDDMAFVLSANGRHGYYASVRREGYGLRDIYLISFLGKEKYPSLSNEDVLLAGMAKPVVEVGSMMAKAEQIKVSNVIILKGVVLDDETGAPLEATISVMDNAAGKEVASFKSNSKTGRFLVSLPSGKNYGISIQAPSHLFHSENVDLSIQIVNQEIVKDIRLKSISVGTRLVLRNVFYDFDKATLRKESISELNLLVKILEEHSAMKIELSSHTDNKGAEKYNLELSQRRSQSVLDYLVSKGIKANRLQAVGYGFSVPIASNDTEPGRQMNRRTEIKIVSK
jgi:outer membrane protein OmpA-like peptidoglycan-associated protein/Tol biopolymer transport system component